MHKHAWTQFYDNSSEDLGYDTPRTITEYIHTGQSAPFYVDDCKCIAVLILNRPKVNR